MESVFSKFGAHTTAHVEGSSLALPLDPSKPVTASPNWLKNVFGSVLGTASNTLDAATKLIAVGELQKLQQRYAPVQTVAAANPSNARPEFAASQAQSNNMTFYAIGGLAVLGIVLLARK